MGYGLLGVSKTSLASSKVTGAVNRLLLNSVVRNWRIIENQIRINLKEKRQPPPSMFDRIFRKIKSQKLTASREPQRHTWLFGVRLHSRHLCLTPLVSVLSLFAGLGKIDWRAKGKHTDRQMPPIRTRERPHPNQASKNILIYELLEHSDVLLVWKDKFSLFNFPQYSLLWLWVYPFVSTTVSFLCLLSTHGLHSKRIFSSVSVIHSVSARSKLLFCPIFVFYFFI